LQWKGLDTLCQALTHKNLANKPIKTNICYTKPENTDLKISIPNIKINDVRWFESPDNLNQIRSNSSIFVSTSIKEPFGLSILESLAAGLCIVIPRDGAYWDQILSDRVNCLKYKANDYQDLVSVLNELQNNNPLMKYLAKNSTRLARGYQAEIKYRHITNTINALVYQKMHTANQLTSRTRQ
jgi:glycosyltransferase involved in cell wall biosynthesis